MNNHTIRIREIDDLQLVPCPTCCKGKIGARGETCPHCKGTGDRVVHETKYYDVRRRDKRRAA